VPKEIDGSLGRCLSGGVESNRKSTRQGEDSNDAHIRILRAAILPCSLYGPDIATANIHRISGLTIVGCDDPSNARPKEKASGEKAGAAL